MTTASARTIVERWARRTETTDARDDVVTRGINFKSVRWMMTTSSEPTEELTIETFGRACEEAYEALREDVKPLALAYFVRERQSGTIRLETGTRRRTSDGEEAVVAGLVRANAGDENARAMVYEEERRMKTAMHAAAPGVSNAFRENACGRVKC